jgi:mannosyl-glycoprotein endo-beta-N-acetylglucosaminidase
MVTIPPPGMTKIAHQHGVKMLGTLIFEWDEGAKVVKMLLNGQAALLPDLDHQQVESRVFAEKLVEIAKHFGFDGYLMNFECNVDPDQVEKLIEWLRFLRTELKKVLPHGLIIWYDSVLHSGQLRWKSALTEENYRFLEVTDGFFGDYHWEKGNLPQSLATFDTRIKGTRPDLASYDVYIGNDTYGRGTFGGGRLDIYKAILEINKLPLSISLFGQAMFYEEYRGFADRQIFNINEDIFWKGRDFKLMADSRGKAYETEFTGRVKVLKDWNMDEGEKAWKISENA